jgi:hypothetical protein
MTEGSGAKDAPHTPNDDERAPGTDVFSGLGDLERRVTLDWVGEHLPEVRRSGVRPAKPVLDPRGQFHSRPGRVRRWIRAQIVGDDGASWVCGRPSLHARLGSVDRCRRGPVPPGPSGGKAAWIQAAA